MPADGSRLSEVAAELGVTFHGPDVALDDVLHDSRNAVPGSLFVAIRGSNVDGHDHAAAAISRGSTAIIVERRLAVNVPQLLVVDSRAALARAAAVVHGHPSRRLPIVGVTGTNGKTTVTHMIEAVARSSGMTTGLIGTLGARIGIRELPLARTTPESSDIQRLFAEMVDARVDLVAMEVSSHALALHRCDAIHFRVAAFTNLSRDHLDFHGDMESYFAEKARLFSGDRSAAAVIWVDDPWGARLAATTPIPMVRVGFEAAADVSGSRLDVDARGSTFTLRAGDREARVRIPVAARFNVANALVASAACLESGIPFDDVCRGLETLPQIPGRFELVPGPWRFQAIVDYAHTPDAVAAVIKEARLLAPGRVLVLLGAGGDRDQEKRPLMGAAAATADLTFVTSDNPRSEDPAAIVAEVVGGVPKAAYLVVEIDRRTAIRTALGMAREGDIVLVLGKGHEQGQEFADGLVAPFDDRLVVKEEGTALAGGVGR